jgi:trehalose 6-phosphate synthase
VLSRLAGASAELGDSGAVLVNPYDAVGVADGLLAAANMPLEERKARFDHMMETLRRNDIHAWRTRFLDALEAYA